MLISNDADFQRIAADRWSSGRSFSGIFRLDQNKLTIGDAIENLYLVASASQAEEWIDKMEFLPV